MTIDECLQALLDNLADDWVYDAVVAHLALLASGGDTRKAKDLAMKIIAKGLSEGRIVVGDTSEGGFHIWEGGTDAVMGRLELLWPEDARSHHAIRPKRQRGPDR